MIRNLIASAAGVTLTFMAASAQAQTPVAPPANPVQAQAIAAAAAGPALPGICVFGQEDALDSSLVGKSISARMQQLVQQSNAELNGIRTKLDQDEQAFTAARATMAEPQQQQALAGFQQREQALSALAQIRDRELQVTDQKALQQVGISLDPVLIDSFSAHKCGVLFAKGSTLLVSPAMDITKDAVSRLDSRIQSVAPFDREMIPEDPASGAGAQAPAAAAAPPVVPRSANPPARAPAAPAGRAGTRK